MKTILICFIILITSGAMAQTPSAPAKHPRVTEVEELIRDEASRYFERRFPGEAFFVRVEVTPLRRDATSGRKNESLPYFDYESEEGIDEWDDTRTPLPFLRQRVTKVSIDLSVPQSFSDERVANLKDELSIYLRLLPYRDDIKIERKIKEKNEFKVPDYTYVIVTGIFITVLLGALIIRSGLNKSSLNTQAPAQAAPVAATGMSMSSAQSSKTTNPDKRGKTSSTAVSGDVNFHDPIKAMDLVRIKIDLIKNSQTFPTLSDMMLLSDVAEKAPERIAFIASELPEDLKKILFARGKGQSWLNAFCSFGKLDFECLALLDQLGRKRNFTVKDRLWEDLLIQIWRMEEKAIPFLKRIPIDHAFVILNTLPKSISLTIGKKAFPGGWGRLLEKNSKEIALAPSVLNDYTDQTKGIEDLLSWSILEDFKKDREILEYLDSVSIDDEKDVYETIDDTSFVKKVRSPFYVVFDQEDEEWREFIKKFSIDTWALAVVNSSRHYIKKILDSFDEKQKIVFSQNLKRYDQDLDLESQINARRSIALLYQQIMNEKTEMSVSQEKVVEEKNAQTA